MTNKLRKQIVSELKHFCSEVYYRSASDSAQFPYCVYDLSVVYSDSALERFSFDLDLWDRSENGSAEAVEDMADSIVKHFNLLNDAKDGNYPTFFLANRNPIDDPDKHIQRVRITFEIQNYSD